MAKRYLVSVLEWDGSRIYITDRVTGKALKAIADNYIQAKPPMTPANAAEMNEQAEFDWEWAYSRQKVNHELDDPPWIPYYGSHYELYDVPGTILWPKNKPCTLICCRLVLTDKGLIRAKEAQHPRYKDRMRYVN